MPLGDVEASALKVTSGLVYETLLDCSDGISYVRAAGTWITAAGLLPAGLTVEARDGDELLAAALGQLDDGADFVKLYLDGPDADTPPFSAGEVSRVVQAVHARGRTVTAHATRLPGTRVCAAAGVDSIEHGFELDADIAGEMAARGCALVTTMTVLKSWLTFGTTTTMPRFSADQIPYLEALSLVRYVEYLRDPEDRGGAGLSHVGPLIEGFVAILVMLMSSTGPSPRTSSTCTRQRCRR